MTRRDKIPFVIIIALFIVALLAVVPLGKGVLGGKPIQLGLDLKGGTHLVYQADLAGIEPGTEGAALDAAIAVIERRVNVLGVSEPIINKLGNDRIVVELAGIEDTERAKAIIGQTALLEFGELAADNEPAKWEDDLGRWKPVTGTANGQTLELTSVYFRENTYVTTGSLGQVVLAFQWDETGSELFEQITTRLQGQQLGIFLGDQPLLGEDGRPIAPVIKSVITSSGIIEGLSTSEATELSKLLNAGRIPVPLTVIYEQTVSPVLGSQFVDRSLLAAIIGVIMVMVFMIVYYRLMGALASLALAFYAVWVLAIFKAIPVTLTLAGIGGFVLSIGMAVDANVLIFERIKEELSLGRTLSAAIEAGFRRAWSAIRDSNVTTFIATLVLFIMGRSSATASAEATGFAVTLAIGVAVSMFTCITVTRLMLRATATTPLAQRLSLFSAWIGKGK